MKGNLGLVREKQAKMDLANIEDPDQFEQSRQKFGAQGTWNQQDSGDDLFQPASLAVAADAPHQLSTHAVEESTVLGPDAKAKAGDAGILDPQTRVSRPSNMFGKHVSV